MTDSQDWWPADWGHYGGLFIRMAWHSAGTYRTATAAAAPAPATSVSRRSTAGPTTATSTRRAACSGRSSRNTATRISWADLMILAGNVALESMGFKTFGFGGGRADIWQPEEDIYWGAKTPGWATSATAATATWKTRWRRADGPDLREPGRPQRQPRPGGLGPRCARDLRPHGDERRRNRRAGRRRPHLRQGARRRRPGNWSARNPKPRRSKKWGLGWINSFGTGKGVHTTTSGIEGAWKPNPTTWDNGYFDMLFGYEWELVKSPAGASSGWPRTCAEDMIPTRTTRRRSTRR
jgi:catalase-peroxidase